MGPLEEPCLPRLRSWRGTSPSSSTPPPAVLCCEAQPTCPARCAFARRTTPRCDLWLPAAFLLIWFYGVITLVGVVAQRCIQEYRSAVTKCYILSAGNDSFG
jgi:hypothetical protein